MKDLNDINVPQDLTYTKDHEWARKENGTVRIGISDFAQDQLGDIVFAELPEVDTEFQQGEEFASLESVKAVSEVYMPISGTITAVNEDLEEQPEKVNESPYQEGWLVEINPSEPSEMDALLDASTYLEMLKGEE